MSFLNNLMGGGGHGGHSGHSRNPLDLNGDGKVNALGSFLKYKIKCSRTF